jgi:hypothetical protein
MGCENPANGGKEDTKKEIPVNGDNRYYFYHEDMSIVKEYETYAYINFTKNSIDWQGGDHTAWLEGTNTLVFERKSTGVKYVLGTFDDISLITLSQEFKDLELSIGGPSDLYYLSNAHD